MYMQMLNTPRRNYLFCALDIASFPAQVAAAYNALLRGTPFVVICQDEHSHKSSVVSCSARARQLGIECGMPLHIVSRRWPDVAVVQRDERRIEAGFRETPRIFFVVVVVVS